MPLRFRENRFLFPPPSPSLLQFPHITPVPLISNESGVRRQALSADPLLIPLMRGKGQDTRLQSRVRPFHRRFKILSSNECFVFFGAYNVIQLTWTALILIDMALEWINQRKPKFRRKIHEAIKRSERQDYKQRKVSDKCSWPLN